jgi:hypothetical protein
MGTNHLHLRGLLRHHHVSALRSDTAGAELERRRLADALGVKTPIGVLPAAPAGESSQAMQARLSAEANGGGAGGGGAAAITGDEMAAPQHQSMVLPTRLDTKRLDPHLLPQQAGSERVLLLVTLDDRARCLSGNWFEVMKNVQKGQLDCKCCCWSAVRGRAYVRISENALERNVPTVGCCPCEVCVVDNPHKSYYDRMTKVVPFRPRCCSPYHCCCGREPCGQVVALAPHACLANECALLVCGHTPLPVYTYLPGLSDADEVVEYLRVAQADFATRKMPGGQQGGACGCFHAKRK